MRAAPAALPLLLVLPAILAAAPVEAANATVTVSNFAFTPATATINVGDTVTWKWSSGSHSVVADPGGSVWCSTRTTPALDCTRTFAGPGTFAYLCSIHPASMKGTVRVIDPAWPDLVVDSVSFSDSGSTRTISVVVKNQGTNSAGASTLRVASSSSVMPVSTIGSQTVASLSGGASATHAFAWSTLGKIGTWTITATVDFTGVVDETNEANNVRTATTSVVVSTVPGAGPPP